MSNTIDLKATPDGVSFRVRVTPRGGRTELGEVRDGILSVRLKAPPVDGAANKELRVFLAKLLGCSRRNVQIVRGIRSRDKTVLVYGREPAEVSLALNPGNQ